MTAAVLALRRFTFVPQPIVTALALVVGVALTAGATLAGNGNLMLGVIPVVLAVVAYAFYVLPVRHSLFLVIFLSLALDAIDEGPWNSPVAPLGSLLAFNLSHTLGISALPIPGTMMILIAMAALLLLRSFRGGRSAGRDGTPTALPLFGALAVSCVTVVYLIGLGMFRGGNIELAKMQVQTFLVLLAMAYIAAMSLRGVEDYRALGRVIVAAAVVKAFYVMYVVHRLAGSLPPGEELHSAAGHGDSLIFAAAAVLLVVRFMERPSRSAATWCILLLPILAIGMQLNNRRIVWVELAAGLLTFIVLSRRSHMKRVAANLVMFSVPLIVAYIAVGWNSQSKIFKPIAMYRSVTDGEVDSSTLYRDLENYNLLMTMRQHPMSGTGFGQPFLEPVVLPDISFFKEYKYMPHNAILGLWAFTGPLGFTGLMMSLVVAMYYAMRSYRLTDVPDERVAAIMIPAIFVIYLAHCWGDIGFSERRTIHLVGPALAMAGQLACRTGAYKSGKKSSRE